MHPNRRRTEEGAFGMVELLAIVAVVIILGVVFLPVVAGCGGSNRKAPRIKCVSNLKNIGLAFRINDSNTKFESIYIRPTNGRADNQLRRNHSTQYFSYPDYSFDRLRKEAPGEYESYADMGLDEWITMKIVVKDAQAKLFLNNNKQPSLVVNDLKLGTGEAGAIGLWVDVGTEGFFTALKISTN